MRNFLNLNLSSFQVDRTSAVSITVNISNIFSIKWLLWMLYSSKMIRAKNLKQQKIAQCYKLYRSYQAYIVIDWIQRELFSDSNKSEIKVSHIRKVEPPIKYYQHSAFDWKYNPMSIFTIQARNSKCWKCMRR